MNRQLLEGISTITLDSDVSSNYDLSFVVDSKASVVLKLQGHQPLTVNLNCQVSRDASLSCLLLNNNEQTVEINDFYQLDSDSNSTVAYSQLNSYPLNSKGNYQLIGQGANLHVLTASISSVEKKFEQNTVHLAAHSSANVDNYGIVIGSGKCEMVVKNTINKSIHNCQTHQTSRLLTYDKKAVGKILPILCIDDNEVAASHACSLGQPDESQVYYLMTRGLSHDEALQLITIGYLMPITQVIEDESINQILKEEIELKVKQSCLK